LLDENLPLDLRHFLAGHQVFTISFMKWKGLRNGELLRRAEGEGFDLMLSRDAGIEYQHNLANLSHFSHIASSISEKTGRYFAHDFQTDRNDQFNKTKNTIAIGIYQLTTLLCLCHDSRKSFPGY
jgi:hypothetical protein